jgi:hypothetical protein
MKRLKELSEYDYNAEIQNSRRDMIEIAKENQNLREEAISLGMKLNEANMVIEVQKNSEIHWVQFNDVSIEILEEDGDYLVSWLHENLQYSSPIRAYWLKDEEEFFAIDTQFAFPLKVDIFMKIPKLPDFTKMTPKEREESDKEFAEFQKGPWTRIPELEKNKQKS